MKHLELFDAVDRIAELFLDAERLVVFCDTVWARRVAALTFFCWKFPRYPSPAFV